MVFEPLDKCCKCGVPTRYTSDYKGKFYCEKHGRNKPKNPNPTRIESMMEMGDRRLPRKKKKLLKNAVIYKFRKEGIAGKVTYSHSLYPKFTCGKYQLGVLFKREHNKLVGDHRKKL